MLRSWVSAASFCQMHLLGTKLGNGIPKRTMVDKAKTHAQKVAIITGSTDGIGLEVARRLAQEGAHVVVSSRNKVNVDRAVEELASEKLSVSGVVCHIGKDEDRQRLVTTALEKYGGIDYMISNAAVNPFVGNIMDSTPEVWDKIFQVNVTSTFMMAKLSVPHMQKRGGGSIIFISSIGAFNPVPTIGPYSVSKTAITCLTKVLAPTLAPMNIRVNCLAPGMTRTKFGSVLWQDEQFRENWCKANNVSRLGEAKDYGGIVSFLCSPDASYIIGENIVAAGGAISRL
ncbi:dehydrogenase/reductase SDR family member 4-like [Ambystoma mexicanum]|uniref:dehydrogenase/reductase SDR family member 4-like n=1 Tax=Ambystoma mexicanum TaxID=8296 RepID=UPI0037E792C7